MRDLMLGVRDPHPTGRTAIKRLLFVADAAVADVDELPRAVRAVLDAAAEVHVLTPTLPERLSWLADDVDRFRHVADERLDTVLGHMFAIGAHADGLAGRGSIMLVVADAVAEFDPDHILIALRGPEHANWQERRLTEHIQERFRLPVSSYAVDVWGHTSTADGPVLLCYDGSDDALHAIERAGALFAGHDAIVVTGWRAAAVDALGSLAWSGITESRISFTDADRAVELARRMAAEGAAIAQGAGMHAEPVAVEVTGRVATTILEIADRHDAATIVLGSRGTAGLRSTLVGSVSNAVARHAHRPTLIVPRPVAPA
jgi:nucleotide-binding universal stress UspA family protein